MEDRKEELEKKWDRKLITYWSASISRHSPPPRRTKDFKASCCFKASIAFPARFFVSIIIHIHKVGRERERERERL